MSDHGYTQLVTGPTTANGTLLHVDHVYYNQPSNDIINARRACAREIIVLTLCVCVTSLLPSFHIYA